MQIINRKKNSMRKSLITMLLLLFLTSCNKFSHSLLNEILLTPQISSMETRGYVKGPSMIDSDAEAIRVIYISAYDISDSKDYFVGNSFKQDGPCWRNYEGNTIVSKFWPIDHMVSFLAYSVAETTPKVKWNSTNSAMGFDLYVDDKSIQDDILVAGVNDMRNTNNPVLMKFNHTQAWVEFIIRADMPSVVNVESITLKDAFSSGLLSVDNKSKTVDCKWDFSNEKSSDYEIVPSGSTTISSKSERISVSAMMPAQDARNFIINYKVDGYTKSTEVSAKVTSWQIGTHYIYNIMISPQLTKSGLNIMLDDNIVVELQQNTW